MDAKFIVGLNDELFFLGCGYNRTMVRSYHIDRKEWTARGNLRHGHKETCFKAVALNGSIYAVMCKIQSTFYLHFHALCVIAYFRSIF